MLEHGLITYDLLWALWKPSTLGFTATHGLHDQPRVFKTEIAEKKFLLAKGHFYVVEGKVCQPFRLPQFFLRVGPPANENSTHSTSITTESALASLALRM